MTDDKTRVMELASCLIYAQALIEYVIFIMWLRSVIVREIRGR